MEWEKRGLGNKTHEKWYRVFRTDLLNTLLSFFTVCSEVTLWDWQDIKIQSLTNQAFAVEFLWWCLCTGCSFYNSVIILLCPEWIWLETEWLAMSGGRVYHPVPPDQCLFKNIFLSAVTCYVQGATCPSWQHSTPTQHHQWRMKTNMIVAVSSAVSSPSL